MTDHPKKIYARVTVWACPGGRADHPDRRLLETLEFEDGAALDRYWAAQNEALDRSLARAFGERAMPHPQHR